MRILGCGDSSLAELLLGLEKTFLLPAGVGKVRLEEWYLHEHAHFRTSNSILNEIFSLFIFKLSWLDSLTLEEVTEEQRGLLFEDHLLFVTLLQEGRWDR